MKIHTSLMLLFIFLVSLVPFSGAQPTRVCSLVGDLNEDRILSEADIRLLDEAILSNNAPLCGDMNADGIINVIDLQLLTLMVLPNFTFNITIPPVTLNFSNVSLLPPSNWSNQTIPPPGNFTNQSVPLPVYPQGDLFISTQQKVILTDGREIYFTPETLSQNRATLKVPNLNGVRYSVALNLNQEVVFGDLTFKLKQVFIRTPF